MTPCLDPAMVTLRLLVDERGRVLTTCLRHADRLSDYAEEDATVRFADGFQHRCPRAPRRAPKPWPDISRASRVWGWGRGRDVPETGTGTLDAGPAASTPTHRG